MRITACSKVETKKALLYSMGDDIVVVEPKELVELDRDDIDEGLMAIERHFPGTELVMFNHKHSYSYTFKAMFRLKEIFRFKAVASVIGDVGLTVPISIKQFLDIFNIVVPVRFFLDMNEAANWLRGMK